MPPDNFVWQTTLLAVLECDLWFNSDKYCDNEVINHYEDFVFSRDEDIMINYICEGNYMGLDSFYLQVSEWKYKICQNGKNFICIGLFEMAWRSMANYWEPDYSSHDNSSHALESLDRLLARQS